MQTADHGLPAPALIGSINGAGGGKDVPWVSGYVPFINQFIFHFPVFLLRHLKPKHKIQVDANIYIWISMRSGYFESNETVTWNSFSNLFW